MFEKSGTLRVPGASVVRFGLQTGWGRDRQDLAVDLDCRRECAFDAVPALGVGFRVEVELDRFQDEVPGLPA